MPATSTAADARRCLRILVIEDHADGRETLRSLLQLLGHEVQVADNGLAGVATALSWGPDVALVDIGLPGLDGLEVARRLRAALGNRVRLVAQTGYGQPGDRQRALAAGFDTYLVKPIDWHVFVQWLNDQARGPTNGATDHE